VDKNGTIFWDIAPCSPLKVNRCFGGKCCLHLQGRRKAEQEISDKRVANLTYYTQFKDYQKFGFEYEVGTKLMCHEAEDESRAVDDETLQKLRSY
jgi:hypothetical protein